MRARSRLPSDSIGIHLKKLLKRIRHRSRVYLGFAFHYVSLLRYQQRERRIDPTVQFIAVILIEHMGDIVACEPVFRHLRKMHPSAKIIWIGRSEYRELVDRNPSVDFVLPVHCLTEKEYLKSRCRFEQIYDLHFRDRTCAMCGPGINRPPSTDTPGNEITLKNFYSFGNILQSMSRHSGLPSLNDKPAVYIPDSARSRVDQLHLPADFVVFHCSSNTPEKEWPKERWIELAKTVHSVHGCRVVEVGLDATFDAASNPSMVPAAGHLSILETAEVIRRSRLFVGIDSGPAHLANAVGTYGIVLLGSYLGFKRYNPFSGDFGEGKTATLIHAEGFVAAISVAEVAESVNAALNRKTGSVE